MGFPGETENDFDQLLDFLVEADLDRVGCFAYSPVEGAQANEIAAHVPEELKQERLQRFMTLQAEISASTLAKKIGKIIEVMVEDTDEEGIVARSQSDAPNIDGMVFVDSDDEFLPGDFLDVRVTDSTEYDLYAVDVRK